MLRFDIVAYSLVLCCSLVPPLDGGNVYEANSSRETAQLVQRSMRWIRRDGTEQRNDCTLVVYEMPEVCRCAREENANAMSSMMGAGGGKLIMAMHGCGMTPVFQIDKELSIFWRIGKNVSAVRLLKHGQGPGIGAMSGPAKTSGGGGTFPLSFHGCS